MSSRIVDDRKPVRVINETTRVIQSVRQGTVGATGPTGPRGLAGLATGTLPFINARNAPYNATGDGVTNDKVALQAAFDAAAVGGDAVYLPAGIYMYSVVQSLTTALNIPGITVIGAGKGKTVLKCIASGVTQTTANRGIKLASNTYLSGITFDGNNAAIASLLGEVSTLDTAMTIVNVNDGASNVTIEDCSFINQWSSGEFDAVHGASNTGAEGFPLVAKVVDNFIVRNCDFEWNSGSGVGINATATDAVTGLVIPAIYARFEGCTFAHNGYKSNKSTRRTKFIGGKGFASNKILSVTVSNCRAFDNVEMGLNFEETDRAVVDNCDVYNTGEYGIHTWGYGKSLQILNSRLRNNSTLIAGQLANERFASIGIRYSTTEPDGLMENVYIYNTTIEDTALANTITVRSTSASQDGVLQPTFYTNHPDAGSWTYSSQLNLAAFVDDVLYGTIVTTPYTTNEAYRVTKGTLSIIPGVVAAQSRVAIAVTLAGLASGDILLLHFPTGAPANGLIYGGHTVALDTVTVYLANVTAASVTNNTALAWPYEWHDYT